MRKIKGLLILLIFFFGLILYKLFTDDARNRIIINSIKKGKEVQIFDIYNPISKGIEIIITPFSFDYNGLNEPEEYVKIPLEGGYIIDAFITWKNGKFIVHNCGGTSTNYNFKLYGPGNLIDIELCKKNECCLENSEGIRIGQNCPNYICK